MDWKVGSPATVTGWKVRRGSFFLSALPARRLFLIGVLV
jgi:hypothetical protein